MYTKNCWSRDLIAPPPPPDSQEDNLCGHTCRYVLRLAPREKDIGDNIDLFSLNDAFLFWQYMESLLSDINGAANGSRVIVLMDLSSYEQKEYFRISKYFQLAFLYYGAKLYNSFFTYGFTPYNAKKPANMQRLQRPRARGAGEESDSILDLFPLIPIDKKTFKELDQPWKKFLNCEVMNLISEDSFIDLVTTQSQQARKKLEEASKLLKGDLDVRKNMRKADRKIRTEPLFAQSRDYQYQLYDSQHLANAILTLVNRFAGDNRLFFNLIPQLPNLMESSLLKMLFLLFYVIKLPKDSDDLITLMESSEIPADALRQLLENICNHSSRHVGILSIRFYEENKFPKKRFSREYGLGDYKFSDEQFIEINIRDASDFGVADTFIANAKHHNAERGTAGTKLEVLMKGDQWFDLETYLHISGASTDSWRKYYQYHESAALHRGISVFLSSIRVANGFFYAQSHSSSTNLSKPSIQRLSYRKPRKDSEKYEVNKRMYSDAANSTILGTSYGIIYPIKVPNREFFQLIDVSQNKRIKDNDYRYLTISVKNDLEQHESSPILGQVKKDEFGFAAFSNLRELIKFKLESLPQLKPEKKTIIDIRFDYDDDDASIKNDALIKHVGRIYQSGEVTANATTTALAFGCRSANDVYAAIQTLYQTWETFAGDQQFQNVETFIYDFPSGLNQALWYGDDIKKVLAVDGSRTVHFGGESLLRVIVENPTYNNMEINNRPKQGDGSLELTPFPLLLKLNDFNDTTGGDGADFSKTLFEASLSQILQRDITNPNRQGYRLPDVHFRIGSKIHISDFYQAFPLFHNSYYVNAFGNLLSKRIYNDCETCLNDQSKKTLILLIGYAGYSELITGRSMQYIKAAVKDAAKETVRQNIDIDYLVFEPSRIGQEPEKGEGWLFRRLRRLKQEYELKSQSLLDFEQILIYQIVPISSTCTTVSKTGDAILRVLNTEAECRKIEIRKNFIPVWVRDNSKPDSLSVCEKTFFDEINAESRQLITKQPLLITNVAEVSEFYKVDYLVSIPTKWYKAVECPLCLPDKDRVDDEKPLIETDKSSVVPFAQFGVRKKTDANITHNQDARLFPNQEENEERLRDSLFPQINDCSFSSFVFYGHRQRSVNHYQYYLNTERILANLVKDENKKFIDWTEALAEKIASTHTKATGDMYDVIVSPLHSTNSGFLDYIVDQVFENNALVINAEFDKDYKDNFEAKYNYLRKQINTQRDLRRQDNNGCNPGIPLTINVYFISDTLNHAGDFSRTKELIVSLFSPEDKNGDANVKVNIFYGIILLVNRLSSSSKLAFIGHDTDSNELGFFSFFDLAISNMRNHEDACTLCSWNNTTKIFGKYSSTNAVAQHWKEKDDETRVERAAAIDWNKSVYIKPSQEADKEEQESQEKKIYGIRKSYYRTMVAHRSKALSDSNETKESLDVIKAIISEAAGDPVDDATGAVNKKSLVLNKTGFIYCKSSKGKERYEEERMLLLISFLRVLSRPFPSFRIATKNAIFKMMIELLNALIGYSSNAPKRWTRDLPHAPHGIINDYLKFFKKLDDAEKNGLHITPARIAYILMGRLTSMGSTFLLQEGVFQKIYEFLNANKDTVSVVAAADNRKKNYSYKQFELMFLVNVKRTTEILGDEAKCLLLENKLREKVEAGEDYFSFTKADGKDVAIDLPIYIENTRILREGIAELDAIRFRDGGTVEQDGIDIKEPPIYIGDIDNWLDTMKRLRAFPYDNNGNRKHDSLYFLDNFTEFLDAGFVSKKDIPKTVGSMVGLSALLGRKSTTDHLRFDKPNGEEIRSIPPKSLYNLICALSRRVTLAKSIDMYILSNTEQNNGVTGRAQYAWFAGDSDSEDSPKPVADRFLAALRDGTVDAENIWQWDSYCVNPLEKQASSEPDNAIYLKFPINLSGYRQETVVMRLSFDSNKPSDADSDDRPMVQPADWHQPVLYEINGCSIHFATAIRSILMYRQKLIDRLEADCENDYFETVRMNRILSDLNTHTHTDSDFLSTVWAAVKMWGDPENKDFIPESNIFLQLLINHYIGDIRIDGLLQDTNSSRRGKYPLWLDSHSRKSKPVADDTDVFIKMFSNNNANPKTAFTLIDNCGEKIDSWKNWVKKFENEDNDDVALYVRDNDSGSHYSCQTYVMIVLQVLLDSVKTCKTDNSGVRISVNILKDSNCDDIYKLSIKTMLTEESFNRLNNSLIDIENRENGVSLVAVYNAVKRLAGDEFKVNDFISLRPKTDESDEFSCTFTLPIFQVKPR